MEINGRVATFGADVIDDVARRLDLFDEVNSLSEPQAGGTIDSRILLKAGHNDEYSVLHVASFRLVVAEIT
jgi:hypothetical protein